MFIGKIRKCYVLGEIVAESDKFGVNLSACVKNPRYCHLKDQVLETGKLLISNIP